MCHDVGTGCYTCEICEYEKTITVPALHIAWEHRYNVKKGLYNAERG